jgi:hypothetical protein
MGMLNLGYRIFVMLSKDSGKGTGPLALEDRGQGPLEDRHLRWLEDWPSALRHLPKAEAFLEETKFPVLEQP